MIVQQPSQDPKPETRPILDTNQLRERSESLKEVIIFHCNQFKKETGYVPKITIQSVELPGYGDQLTKFLGFQVQIEIDL